jgi:hypothetical protein
MNLFLRKKNKNFKILTNNYKNENTNNSEKLLVNKSTNDLSMEWNNSIYTFNKQYYKTLFYKNNALTIIFESYFNLLNKRKTKNRLTKNSINKVFISELDIKHTNHLASISLFLFNKNKNTIFYNLKKLRVKFFNKSNFIGRKDRTINQELKQNLYKLIQFYYKLVNNIHTFKSNNNYNLIDFSAKNDSLKKNIYTIISYLLKNESKIKLVKINKGSVISKKRKYDHLNFKNLNSYKFLAFYQKLAMANYISKNWFLNYKNFGLINLISNMYNKSVDIKINNLSFMHLNSSIFAKAINFKLLNKKKNVLRIFKKALYNVKFPSLFTLSNKIDNVNNLIKMKSTFLQSLKYKFIIGIRIEGSGKLNRRKSAARSIFKVRHVGSLKNIYSSFRGLSSSLLRGNLKSNLQYSLINSKTTNGSFGLKAWVNSY